MKQQKSIKTISIFAMILIFSLLLPVYAQQDKYNFPAVADLAVTKGLQNPFLKPDGTLVQTKEEWPAQREYLKAMLIHYQYGTIPPKPEKISVDKVSSEKILEGKGILDLFNITISRNGKSVTLHCSLYRPNKPGKFPIVIKNDRDIKENENILAKAFEMGYAISKYAREDLAMDNRNFVRKGGAYDLYPEYTWGAIGVWAWGYQLVIDVFEQMDVIDLDKIVTTGNSRGGKAALAGAIFDERIAIAGPNCSGLGGTASARIFEENHNEQDIQISLERRPYWWGPQWYEFASNDEILPFDAHFNKIVLAPRGLHDGNATKDYWANPLGTELTHRAAKKVYKWLGVEENIGIHWRIGGHAQTYDDWVALLDFADLYFYKKDNGNEFDRLLYPDEPLPINWETPPAITTRDNKKAGHNFPPVPELPEVKTLPDPFKFFGSDRRVVTQEDWQQRREEMKALIQYYEYGQGFPLPYNTIGKVTSQSSRFEGKATYYEVDLSMGPNHSITANVNYMVPTAKKGPLPVLILTSYLPDRTTITNDWIENVIDRGYIVAEFFVLQFTPYEGHERTVGQVQQAYPEYDGSVLQEWSWGCSGVISYLSSLEVVDTDRIIVSGNSRRGKMALLTGVMDERVDLTVASCSGCQGMPIFRFYGEKACHLSKPATIHPGWSNDRFKEFIDKETLLPFDQHFMAALIAPRALLAVEGSKDNNANQEGSQESYTAAKHVYEWLGVPGNIGWYEHIGGHGYFEEDMYATLDFADKVFEGKTPKSGKEFDRLVYPRQKHLVNWTAPDKNGINKKNQ